MLEFLQTGKALSVFAAIGLIGIVSKLITRSLYRRLLKETENMAMTKNKNLRALKQKLENAYRLNQNIVNTQAYLDKEIYGFRYMNASLNGWNNVSVQMTILGLLAGAFGSFMSYWYRLDSYYIVLYASVGAMSGLFLTFLDSSFNIPLKQQRLSNALLEYVDNSVFVRAVRENTGRDTAREFAAASRDYSGSTRGQETSGRQKVSSDGDTEREMGVREDDLRNGLVRDGEPRRLIPRNVRTRNEKADDLMRTVRSLKPDEMEEDGADADRTERSGRSGVLRKSAAGQKGASAKPGINDGGKAADMAGRFQDGKDQEGDSRRDIDYLKRSLEQIAASKERSRNSNDWTKNLDPEEMKVLGEIMRQYFAGN